jgi:DNA-binding CsgD family transcriptional regulator
MASEHGHDPNPGFALLRLAEGDVDAAVAAVTRMVDESRGQRTHAVQLAAAVDVLLAAGDVPAARAASEELDRFAGPGAEGHLGAVCDHAGGSVLLAEGDATGALTRLRRAAACWRDLEMPFETARARARIALACRAVHDEDAAALELDAARAVFERLGARSELARLAASGGESQRPPGGLSPRECEVLRLVATGVTNREVAAALHISEHTVARHLQNIYAKLGLSSRAAATAYAHTNGLA